MTLLRQVAECSAQGSSAVKEQALALMTFLFGGLQTAWLSTDHTLRGRKSQ